MPFKKKRTIYLNEYLAYIYQFAIVLVLFGLCRILFYTFNANMFPNVSLRSFGRMMYGGVIFDLSALFYLNSLYFVFAIIPSPWSYNRIFRIILKWLFLIFNSIGLALNVLDFRYYPFIQKRTTFNVADILKNEENIGQLFWSFLHDYWLFFLLWLALVLLLNFLYSRVIGQATKYSKKWFRYPVGFFALLVFSVLAMGGIRGGFKHSTRPITLSNAGAFVNSPEEVAIVLNTPFSVIRTIGKKTFTPMNYFNNDKELEQVFSPIIKGNDSLIINKKNVVVIILESFGREFFGCFNDSIDGKVYKGYTPFLDSLAQHSLVFPNAFANGIKSIDAMPSIASGIPSLVLPYVISEYSFNKVNSLANLLKPYAYKSSFFHGAPNGSMGFDAFANMAGFERYVGKNEFGNDDFYDGIWGIWDEEFFQFYANELSKENEPFVSMIFSVSSHHPYKLPERYQGVFEEGEIPLQKCISYTDYSLKQFFKTAKKQAWFENTLFVITADHSIYSTHKQYRNNMQSFAVPLFFYTPDGSLQGVDKRLAQQIDILPTVLSYLNYPGCYVAFGKNLLDDKSTPYVINYIADSYQLIMDDYVLQFNGSQVTADYNYVKDPGLRNKLRGEEDYSKQLNFMKAIIQQYNNRMIKNDLLCD